VDLHPFSAIVGWVRRSGRRVAITVVGFVLLLAGGIMMVTPGPGVLVILAGLAILASEWAWAERALDRARQRSRATIQYAAASPFRIAVSVVLTLGGIAAGIFLWMYLR
jgi:uncharacterized protein (TIGR02611 family)